MHIHIPLYISLAILTETIIKATVNGNIVDFDDSWWQSQFPPRRYFEDQLKIFPGGQKDCFSAPGEKSGGDWSRSCSVAAKPDDVDCKSHFRGEYEILKLHAGIRGQRFELWTLQLRHRTSCVLVCTLHDVPWAGCGWRWEERNIRLKCPGNAYVDRYDPIHVLQFFCRKKHPK